MIFKKPRGLIIWDQIEYVQIAEGKCIKEQASALTADIHTKGIISTENLSVHKSDVINVEDHCLREQQNAMTAELVFTQKEWSKTAI